MRIFLYEALVLGLIGAGIGGVLSFGGAFLAVSVMLQSTTYLFVPSSLVYILYGMLFGIGTSLLSGLYPAWRAANLNPSKPSGTIEGAGGPLRSPPARLRARGPLRSPPARLKTGPDPPPRSLPIH